MDRNGYTRYPADARKHWTCVRGSAAAKRPKSSIQASAVYSDLHGKEGGGPA